MSTMYQMSTQMGTMQKPIMIILIGRVEGLFTYQSSFVDWHFLTVEIILNVEITLNKVAILKCSLTWLLLQNDK